MSIFQKSINITLDSKCRLFQNLLGSLGEYTERLTHTLKTCVEMLQYTPEWMLKCYFTIVS